MGRNSKIWRENQLDQKTILHLEWLSLVDFTNVEGIKRLEEAIEFAQPLREITTENVEPMFTVQDDATLRLGSYFWLIRKLAGRLALAVFAHPLA